MANQKATQADTIKAGDVVNVKPAEAAFLRLIQQMDTMATMDDGQPGTSGEDVGNILLAETEEDMWKADERGPLGGRDLAGCELHVFGFEVKFGRARDDIKTIFVTHAGKQMYLLVNACRISDSGAEKDRLRLPEVGESFQFNTSAPRIVAKLFWHLHHGNFDGGASVPCVIEAIDLGSGQAVIKLKPLSSRAVPSAQTVS